MRRHTSLDAGRDVLAVLEQDLPATPAHPQSRSQRKMRLSAPMTSGTAAVRPPGSDVRQVSPAQVAAQQSQDEATLEREAAMVLSAMEAAEKGSRPSGADRRESSGRVPWRVKAHLKLWADGDDGEAWTLFTRDVDPRAMGFICRDNIPLGYGGVLTFIGPGSRRQRLEVTITRCRPCSSGWCEGALHFNQPHPWLVEEILESTK